MPGRKTLLAFLALLLGLVDLVGLSGAARAQSTFTVMPDPPNVADRPLFTYIATTPPGQCHPDFAPVPQITGNEIVFQGTPSSSPVTPECSGSWLTDWQIDPLPVGSYVARVKVGADEVASLSFDVVVSNPPPPVPPLTVDPEHPTTRDSLFLAVSGIATSFCPPRFTVPEVHGTDIVLSGTSPLFPVTPDCQGPWTQQFSVPPLPAGTYRIEVLVDGTLYASQSVQVVPFPVRSATLQVDPLLPTTADPITLAASLTASCPTTFGPAVVHGNHIELPATLNFGACSGTPAVHTESATVGLLPAEAYTAELTVDGEVVASQGLTVTAPTTALSLVDDRFAVTLARAATATGGAAGPGFAVPLTDRSGYFWFFGSGNIEVTVKILDGRAVNGHFWLFAASMTDVPFTLSVTDLASPGCSDGSGCPVKSYTSTAGKNENFIDIGSL